MASGRIFGDGPAPCRQMLVGDYCGWQEVRSGRPFVGEAGQELNRRFIDRAEWYITNLVPVFVKDAKDCTPELIAEWADVIEADFARVKPDVVVAAGGHITRYLLGDDVDLERTHGLPHQVPGRPFVVIPVYNPAAGIREPELYATPLVWDFKQVAGYLAGTVPIHTPDDTPRTYSDSRHTRFLGAGPLGPVAIDREGPPDAPECFTVAFSDRAGHLFRADDPMAIRQLADLVAAAEYVIFHAALDDRASLERVGIAVPYFVDTMVEAALLQQPRGLKTLAYRLGRRRLREYLEMIRPIDDARVKAALRARYRYLRVRWAKLDIPKRGLTSLKGVLRKRGKDSLRDRWSRSKYTDVAPLPPVPSWADIPAEIGVPYACDDAIETWKVHQVLSPGIRPANQQRTLRAVMGTLPFLQRMVAVGSLVDADKLRKLSVVFDAEIQQIAKAIRRRTGYAMNPISGDQVAELLFERLGLPPTKRTPKGKHYSTEDKYLEAMKGQHPVIPLIIRARLLNKMKGTYSDRLPTLLVNGRYHQDPRYASTTTLRLAEPVMLLVPKHTAEGKAIRKCFPADEGHVLLSVDLSQIELRVAAHLSQDPVLIDAYERGIDLHAQTAHKMLGAPKNKADQDDSLHRLPAKTFNFRLLMGTTWMGVRDELHEQGQLQWTDAMCQEMHTKWFAVHAGFQDYVKRMHQHARRYGYVENLFGHRMYCPGVRSTVERVRDAQERCAQAWPIQSTAREIAQRWIARIWREVNLQFNEPHYGRQGIYCEPWAWIHDDVTQEVSTPYADAIGRAMLRLVPQDLCVPVTAEASVGPNWAEQTKHPEWSPES